MPQDLSVVGFDDIQFAQYCDHTANHHFSTSLRIGRQAMLMMLDLLKSNDVQARFRVY
ncbi:substrate-binding domain-containing protein [Vibrio chagasii]|nr:substrate-binding domain-containing protein [Vibrio chagasii]